MGFGALFTSVSMLGNAYFVKKLGMRRLSHWSMIAMIIPYVAFFLFAPNGGASLLLFFCCITFSKMMVGFIGPNSSAIAMEPLGHVAGSASSIYGFMTTFLAAAIGGVIAGQLEHDPATIMAGNLIALVLGLLCILWAEDWKLFKKTPD
jgi:DHA1 family bicyclomycin/chloramphenicol resistance-like MFS transporter